MNFEFLRKCCFDFRRILPASLMLFVGYGQSTAWIKFTDEELKMVAPSWCPNANAVVLDQSVECEVYVGKFGYKLIEEHSIRIKILNDKGKDNGTVPIVVPQTHKVSEIAGRTISKTGEITKVKQSQIIRKVLYAGEDNSRRIDIYQIAFPEVQAGSILELSYTSRSDNVFLMTPYYLDVDGIPTQSSTLKFKIPQGMTYMKSGLNTELYQFEETIESLPLAIEYRATCSNVLTHGDEPFAPGDDFLRPQVYFVFSQYHYFGKTYDITPDWKAAVGLMETAFEDYYEDRIKPDLTASIQSFYPEMSPAEAIYRWVTDSIQFVDSRNCFDFDKHPSKVIEERHATGMEKALTLIRLYREIDLPARILLATPINQRPVMTRLPSLVQFETYIVQSRVDGDFVYLDPTRKQTAFGRYPWYLNGAYVLSVDTNYADILTLPVQSSFNQRMWNMNAVLDTAGNLRAEGTIEFTNQFCMDYRDRMFNADSSEFTKLIQDMLDDEHGMVIEACSLETKSVTDTSFAAFISLRIDNYAEPLDNVIFFRPNFVDKMTTACVADTAMRTVEVALSHPQKSIVAIEIKLPDGYSLSDEPKRIRIKDMNDIVYYADIIPDKVRSVLMYRRVYQRDNYVYPANQYDYLCEFWHKTAEYEQTESVISKTSEGSDGIQD